MSRRPQRASRAGGSGEFQKITDMNTALLNEVAAKLNITDKNLCISIAIKGLVDLGYNVRTAYEMVMGEGSFGKMAAAVRGELVG